MEMPGITPIARHTLLCYLHRHSWPVLNYGFMLLQLVKTTPLFPSSSPSDPTSLVTLFHLVLQLL